MIAGLLHDWFAWPDGAVLTNLVASAIGIVLGYLVALRHLKCRDCWRPGRVPVSGQVHHVCKKHAIEQGHAHR